MENPENNINPDKLEAEISSELSRIIEDHPIHSEFYIEQSADWLFALELWIPWQLMQKFHEWREESIDGFSIAMAYTTSDSVIRIIGTCILISDQTVTPFVLDLALTNHRGQIESFRLSLGEKGGGHLGISGPAYGSEKAIDLLENLVTRLSDICWVYTIEEGVREATGDGVKTRPGN
jgi:hypothetical protein